jgi:hypothetical protein
MAKRTAGEILLEYNYINKQSLSMATENFKKTGQLVVDFLIQHGDLTENDMAQCLSLKYGFPYVEMQDCQVDQDVVKLISKEIAAKYLIMPVEKTDKEITIFMVDPFDSEAMEAVEKATKLKVQPFVGLVSEIKNAIAVNYGEGKSAYKAPESAISMVTKMTEDPKTMTEPKSPIARVSQSSAAGNDNMRSLAKKAEEIRLCQKELESELASFRDSLDSFTALMESLSERIKGIKK